MFKTNSTEAIGFNPVTTNDYSGSNNSIGGVSRGITHIDPEQFTRIGRLLASVHEQSQNFDHVVKNMQALSKATIGPKELSAQLGQLLHALVGSAIDMGAGQIARDHSNNMGQYCNKVVQAYQNQDTGYQASIPIPNFPPLHIQPANTNLSYDREQFLSDLIKEFHISIPNQPGESIPNMVGAQYFNAPSLAQLISPLQRLENFLYTIAGDTFRSVSNSFEDGDINIAAGDKISESLGKTHAALSGISDALTSIIRGVNTLRVGIEAAYNAASLATEQIQETFNNHYHNAVQAAAIAREG